MLTTKHLKTVNNMSRSQADASCEPMKSRKRVEMPRLIWCKAANSGALLQEARNYRALRDIDLDKTRSYTGKS